MNDINDTNESSGNDTNDRTTQFLLREERPESLDGLRFGHQAYVDTLADIVHRVEPPWHIGLYGTWGSGKSTIIDFLYRRIRSSQSTMDNYPSLGESEAGGTQQFDNILCVKFNAWKHAEESVRTELMLDLNQALAEELERRFDRPLPSPEKREELNGESELERSPIDEGHKGSLYGYSSGILSSGSIIEELYDVSEIKSERRKSLSQSFKNLDRLHYIVIFGFTLFVSLLLIPAQVGFPVPESIFGFSLGWFQTVPWNWVISLLLGGMAVVAGAYLEVVFSDFRDARRDVRKTLANPQKDWSGAYENLYDKLIDETNELYRDSQDSDSPEDIDKIVITIDDLDRCTSQTAYEILIALKSFFRHKKCIYIIPCDEDALYKHIEAADDGEYLGDTRTQQNFLAKFFQTELEIPTPSQPNLESYFGDQIDQMDREFTDRSLQVLYDAELNTPRRIIRTLNRVATLEELAEKRDLIGPESPTNSPTKPTDSGTDGSSGDSAAPESYERAFLAVIAVLQKDFPRFHAELETDPYFLDEVSTALREELSGDSRAGLDSLLEEVNVPTNRRDALVSFLTQEQDVIKTIEDPAPYMRLSGEERDPKTMFEARFNRGSVQPIRQLVDEVKEEQENKETTEGLSESEEAELSGQPSTLEQFTNYVVREVKKDTTQQQSISTAIEIAGAFPKAQRRAIANAVLEVIREEEVPELLTGIDFESLGPTVLELPPEKRTTFMEYYMRSIIGEEGINEDNFASLLDAPDTLFDNIEVQVKFAETIESARQRGLITPEEYAKILGDIREYKPVLYTPKLVQVKR